MRYLFFYFVRFHTISRRSSSAGSTQPANKAAIRISRAVSGSHRNTSPPKYDHQLYHTYGTDDQNKRLVVGQMGEDVHPLRAGKKTVEQTAENEQGEKHGQVVHLIPPIQHPMHERGFQKPKTQRERESARPPNILDHRMGQQFFLPGQGRPVHILCK